MAQTPIPIFCFHLGAHPYVASVMQQARQWNPLSPIYLITDQPQERFPDITVVPVLEYSASALECQHSYKHMSSNAFDIELMCLQRWFVLSEVLMQLPYDRCFIMDSDVLLYSDITAEHEKYKEYKFTLTCQMSPGECYFNTDIVHQFVQILDNAYRKKNDYYWDMIDAFYNHIVRAGAKGGISDMAFLTLFAATHSGNWLDSTHIINGATFDHHVNTDIPGFQMENGKKKIIWKDNQPYGLHLARNEEIRFLSLHFQGGAKNLIESHLRTPVIG